MPKFSTAYRRGSAAESSQRPDPSQAQVHRYPVLGLETPIFQLEILILADFARETYLKPGVLVLTTCRPAEKGVRLI